MTLDPRRLCQIEIAVSDLPRALTFYREAFGWEAVPAELHEYVVLKVPDDCPFGISLVPGAKAETRAGNVSGATLYFGCDDPEAVVAGVETAGGKRRFGPMKLFGYGQIHQVEDPDGTRFGLYLKR